MKQLKFMLAAATALGLATASQAGVEFTDNFDTRIDGNDTLSIATGTKATALAGYTYAGTGEDYSEVVAADETHNSQMLHVDTDGTPLTRSLGDSSWNLGNYESVYIDTMVKFTATPIGDTVTQTEGDKLMIYLQATNEVTTVEGKEVTNDVNKLMVKALQYKPGYSGWSDEYEDIVNIPPTKNVGDWDVEYFDGKPVEVSANTWYSLKVTTELVDNVPMFNIYLGGKLLKPKTNLNMAESNSTYFPSLLAENSATLTSVGFAGEGWIDDLAFGTVTTVTPVDFTLALGEGVSAVSYIVGETSGDLPTADGAVTVALNGVSVTLSNIQYVPGYEANSVVDDTSYTPEAGATITVDAKQKQIVTDGNTPTTGAAVGFTGTPFADFTGTALQNVVAWAGAGHVAATTVKNMSFNSTTGNPAGEAGTDELLAEEAYLLNCSPAQVATAKAAFKFAAFDPTDPPDATDFGTGYNGDVVIEGATTLSGENGPDWDKDCTNPKFYRARLVFPGTYPPPAAE